MREYSIASLPIVHLGFRDVLTRLSVAYACLTHSTDETHEKVIVRKEHVEQAVKFYLEMLEELKLKDYKLAEEGKLEISETEIAQIIAELDEISLKILDEIKISYATAEALASKLEVSEETIKRRYKILKKWQLIQTSPKGISLSPRGILLLRYIASSGVTVSKNDTNLRSAVSKNDTVTPNYAYTLAICEYCGKHADCLKVDGHFICKECLKEEQNKQKCYKRCSTENLIQTEDIEKQNKTR
jgi:hypothetical protein